MKKILCLLFALLLSLSGCRKNDSTVTSSAVETVASKTESVIETVSAESQISSVQSAISQEPTAVIESKPQVVSSTPPKTEEKVITKGDLGINSGVWLSFYEVEGLLTDKKGFKAAFYEVVKNSKELGITDIYFHIRSHCDSVVKSDLFPQKEKASAVNYDVLEYAITLCHKEGLKLHGWINPYRVTASHSDVSKLPKDSPALKWLNEGKTKNVIVMNGIYLNPAEAQVQELIINGVKELINKYSLDGIHFDDYFYPTTNPEFDKKSYSTYKEATKNPLSLDDWRRANVDCLISATKTAIELSGKSVIFSVSPSADIWKNYNTHYADIKSWLERDLIDEIIPQIYFGFAHTDQNFNFDKLLKDWQDLCGGHKAKLKIGLASYKAGTESKTDGTEWKESSDILSRQLKLCKEKKVDGVVFYSYSSLFSNQEPNRKERENLIN